MATNLFPGTLRREICYDPVTTPLTAPRVSVSIVPVGYRGHDLLPDRPRHQSFPVDEITFTGADVFFGMSGKVKALIALVMVAAVAYVLLSSNEPVEIVVEE